MPDIVRRRALANFYGIRMVRAEHVGQLNRRQISEAFAWMQVEAEIDEDMRRDREE